MLYCNILWHFRRSPRQQQLDAKSDKPVPCTVKKSWRINVYVGSHLKDGAITVQIPHHCKPSSNNNFFVESNVRSSQNSKATSDSAPYTNPTVAWTEHSGCVKDPGKVGTIGSLIVQHASTKSPTQCFNGISSGNSGGSLVYPC